MTEEKGRYFIVLDKNLLKYKPELRNMKAYTIFHNYFDESFSIEEFEYYNTKRTSNYEFVELFDLELFKELCVLFPNNVFSFRKQDDKYYINTILKAQSNNINSDIKKELVLLKDEDLDYEKLIHSSHYSENIKKYLCKTFRKLPLVIMTPHVNVPDVYQYKPIFSMKDYKCSVKDMNFYVDLTNQYELIGIFDELGLEKYSFKIDTEKYIAGYTLNSNGPKLALINKDKK